jgi:branched-chain amino acid transport system permease protein
MKRSKAKLLGWALAFGLCVVPLIAHAGDNPFIVTLVTRAIVLMVAVTGMNLSLVRRDSSVWVTLSM